METVITTATAIKIDTGMGIKAGMLRMKLVWPFPRKEVYELSKRVHTIIIPEMNLGQIYHPIREFSDQKCRLVPAPKVGGEMHLPDELFVCLKEAKK